MENSRSPSPTNDSKEYVTPTENDILCGRGRAAYDRPANRKLRAKVFESLEEYKGSTRTGKTALIRGIIADLTQDGGRFLKFDVDSRLWYNGGSKAAKGRIGSAMRDAATPDKVKYIGKLKASSASSTSREQEDGGKKLPASQTPAIGAFTAAQLPPTYVSAPLGSTIVPFSESNEYHRLRHDNPWVEDSMARLRSICYGKEASARTLLADTTGPIVALPSDNVVWDQASRVTPHQNGIRQQEADQLIESVSTLNIQQGLQIAGSAERMREQDQALMSHIVMFNATRDTGFLPTTFLDPSALKKRIADFNASRGTVLASLRSGGGGDVPPHAGWGSTGASMSVPADSLPWPRPPHRTSARTNGSASELTSRGMISPMGELDVAKQQQGDEEASFCTAMLGDRHDSTGSLLSGQTSASSNNNHNAANAAAIGRGKTSTTRFQSTSRIFSFPVSGLMQDHQEEAADDDDDDASFFTKVLDGIKSSAFESLKEFP